jgi:hypothetical protein
MTPGDERDAVVDLFKCSTVLFPPERSRVISLPVRCADARAALRRNALVLYLFLRAGGISEKAGPKLRHGVHVPRHAEDRGRTT